MERERLVSKPVGDGASQSCRTAASVSALSATSHAKAIVDTHNLARHSDIAAVGLVHEGQLLSEEFNGLDMMVTEDRPHFEKHLRRFTLIGQPRPWKRGAIPPERGGALGAVGRYRHLRP